MDYNGSYPGNPLPASGLPNDGVRAYNSSQGAQPQGQSQYYSNGPANGNYGAGGYPQQDRSGTPGPGNMMQRLGPNGQYPQGPGYGRGGYPGPAGLQRAVTMDVTLQGNSDSPPPLKSGFGGAFPALPGQARRNEIDTENEIMAQMTALALTEQANRPGAQKKSGGFGFSRGPRYGNNPQRDSSGSIGGGDIDINGGMGLGAPDLGKGPYDFNGPSRSMTMPFNDFAQQQQRPPQQGMPPPQRTNTMGGPMGGPIGGQMGGPMRGPMGGQMGGPMGGQMGRQMGGPMGGPGPNGGQLGGPMGGQQGGYGGPGGLGGYMGAPPRPSTATGNRPPPQRMYPGQGPPQGPNNAQYDNYSQSGYGQFDEAIDNYYGSTRMSNPEFGSQINQMNGMGMAGPPQGNPGPQQGTPAPNMYGNNSRPSSTRESMEMQMQMQTQSPGKSVNRTKSQPNLRNPMDMPGEVPPMPQGNFQAFSGNGPALGPGGYPGGPAPNRQSGGASGHPVPVRPGLMNMDSKPIPVRNYGGGPTIAPAQPPVQVDLQQHMQQQLAPQPPPTTTAPGKTVEAPVTAEELDKLRAIVKRDPNDQASALKLGKKLVEAANVLVPQSTDLKTKTRARDRFLTDAHKILKKVAGSGQNAEAMFFMADCLGRGLWGGEPDNKEAFTLYQSAAKLGHGAAAYRTAVCCEIGHEDGGGTRKDPLKAMQWYKRAATLGDTPAMYKVGMILLKGLLGQNKDPREAVGWLKRAAERADAENPHSLHELGLLYESAGPNDSIIRDEAYAFSLFLRAAELGYKFSQFRLGCAFEYGLLGCPIDPRQSIMWYSKAAQQEEHQSELSLSGWYLTGSDGVLGQSDTEAYLWARKAAMAGLAKAEYAMGYFTEVGIGVPANMEDAKRWYWRAAAQDFPKARERLEDLKRAGKSGPRQRERISRSNMATQQATDGECSIM
ncbi:hypothetical protein TD95_005286 [Thielaviopsis punctulata]|uniref:Uncharacterized protein n=1 Tax=Thielaviopsis punctulata TaxID=72032 RepID=A0A0F4Z8Z7_9PEZI|nr:hypothetical protein TD95_005286 [Thielaviopsis punctulata]